MLYIDYNYLLISHKLERDKGNYQCQTRTYQPAFFFVGVPVYTNKPAGKQNKGKKQASTLFLQN